MKFNLNSNKIKTTRQVQTKYTQQDVLQFATVIP